MGELFSKNIIIKKKLDIYVEQLKKLGIGWIEVSDGNAEISIEDRASIIKELKDEFVVVGEIGCKDADKIMPPSQWIGEMNAVLEAGCRYVITEGRDSGTAGVYRPTGEIRTGLVSDIATSIDTNRIIFEAPRPKSQMFLINMLGANVNFGNVSPRDLLLLEAQRCGLRNETFYMMDK